MLGILLAKRGKFRTMWVLLVVSLLLMGVGIGMALG